MRKFVILILFAIVAAESTLLLLREPPGQEPAVSVMQNAPGSAAAAPQLGPPAGTPQRLLPDDAPPGQIQIDPQGRYVIDVVLHSYEEINELLNRAEDLAEQPRPAAQQAAIAIILHGPEIDLFSIRNYPKYRELVDKAARLDAYNIIDVKMCQTTMRERGLRNEDVPGFIELVPYAPDEIERLQEQGYVKI